MGREHASPEELDDAVLGLDAIETFIRRHKLAAIAEHDRRAQWRDDGCRSEAEWVKLRTGCAWETATEEVRVANALEELPAVAAAYGSAALSYDQIRAVTKIADASTDETWAEEARLHTVRQLQRMAARARPASDDEETSRRSFRSRWDEEDRGLRFWGRLPAAEGKLVTDALDAMAKGMPADPSTGRQDLYEARLADALVELAHAASGGGGTCDCPASDAPTASVKRAAGATVIVHAQAEAITSEGFGEIERGPALGPETIRRLACDGRIQVVLSDEHNNPLDYGRRQRTVSWQLARHLWHRDGGCVAPGCDRTSLCEAHHLLHWAYLGKTEPENLALLCWVHHRSVHEGRFRMERTGEGRFRFFRPDGSEICAGRRGLEPGLARRIQGLLFGRPSESGPDPPDTS